MITQGERDRELHVVQVNSQACVVMIYDFHLNPKAPRAPRKKNPYIELQLFIFRSIRLLKEYQSACIMVCPQQSPICIVGDCLEVWFNLLR